MALKAKLVSEFSARSLGWEPSWFKTVLSLLKKYKCGLRIFEARSSRSNFYLTAEQTIYLSFNTPPKVFPCFLHELGHHILRKREMETLEEEREAWRIAERLAKAHNLPWSPAVKKKCLASYYDAYGIPQEET